jgi:hypothetical protein
LTPLEAADCAAFKRLLNATNTQRREQGKHKITYVWLQKASGIHQNTWGSCARAELAMNEKVMAWIGQLFSVRPQDQFERWPWRTLVQVAPDERIGFTARALSGLLEPERAEVMGAVLLLLRASPSKRRKAVQAIRKIVASVEKDARRAKKSAA